MASSGDIKPKTPTSAESAPGTTFSDFLPIPTDAQPVTEPNQQDLSNSLADEPTLSHSLAMTDHDEKGAAQEHHEEEDVANLGWNQRKEAIAAPLVGGIDNEELWLLLRRFNKVR